MGNNEDGKSCKPEKLSLNAPDQSNVHVYPDLAAMQAYYGHRVAVPPYINSTVAPGCAPHPYMWGQPIMPPYGTPYTGYYAHGGVYPHHGVPLVSCPQADGKTSSPAVSQTMDAASAKSSGNTDQRLMSRLKGSNGLGMSIGHCNVDNGDGTDHGSSQSGQTEGSSDGSNIHTTEVGERSKKRSHETTPNNSGDGKSRRLCSPQRTREVNEASEKGTGLAVNPGNKAEKVAGTAFSPTMTTTMELRNPVGTLVKPSPTSRISPAVPGKAWLQNEREMKWEKRKQSNRESARRSRLRKQAEAEELAVRVQSLTSENLALRTEINKFVENTDKLKVENAALVERLKNKQGQAKEVALGKIDDKRLKPVTTADLLARVNDNDSFNRTNEDGEVHENNSTSGAMLHQLLDASPRTDHAVAAR